MREKNDTQNLLPISMISLGTDELRKHMGEILDCVNLRGDQYVIERKGKPLALLIPIQKHCMNLQRDRQILETFMNRSGVGLSDDEAMDLANEAKHESRKNS